MLHNNNICLLTVYAAYYLPRQHKHSTASLSIICFSSFLFYFFLFCYSSHIIITHNIIVHMCTIFGRAAATACASFFQGVTTPETQACALRFIYQFWRSATVKCQKSCRYRIHLYEEKWKHLGWISRLTMVTTLGSGVRLQSGPVQGYLYVIDFTGSTLPYSCMVIGGENFHFNQTLDWTCSCDGALNFQWKIVFTG